MSMIFSHGWGSQSTVAETIVVVTVIRIVGVVIACLFRKSSAQVLLSELAPLGTDAIGPGLRN